MEWSCREVQYCREHNLQHAQPFDLNRRTQCRCWAEPASGVPLDAVLHAAHRPHRYAIAMPSPVVTPGLVVLGYTCPAPPVASIVTGATKLRAEVILGGFGSGPQRSKGLRPAESSLALRF